MSFKKLIKCIKYTDIFVIILKKYYSHLEPDMAQVRDQKLIGKIALALKQLREEKGLSQEEVYNETNIHIGRIETGKANPTISTLSVLCKYYKLRLPQFFDLVEGAR
jgi:DNA-binding XRE family transcriptional regulator